MNTYAKVLIAAVAVVVIAVAGLNLLPANGGIGGAPAATPSPTASPTPTPTARASTSAAVAWPSGNLASGRHDVLLRLCDPRGPQFGCNPDTQAFSFDLTSSSWTSDHDGILQSGVYPDSFAWIWFNGPINAVSTDPCARTYAPVGSTAELADALTTIAGTAAVGPTDVTVGGLPGKLVVLTLPKDPACDRTTFWLFGDGSVYPNTQASTIKVRVVEVDGAPFIVFSDQATPNPELDHEIDRIVDSIRFD